MKKNKSSNNKQILDDNFINGRKRKQFYIFIPQTQHEFSQRFSLRLNLYWVQSIFYIHTYIYE